MFTWNAIRAAQRAGKAVLLATNSGEDCEVMCDRIGLVSNGKLLAVDTVAQLKKRHLKDFSVKINEDIRSVFPKALPSKTSCPQMLTWKIPLPESGRISQHLAAFSERLNSPAFQEACITLATLDDAAENASLEALSGPKED
ncbi:unnamed protein product [Nippostrongylus brasiliensis]|uniref:ABC transporter ATP-binding protein n=1 Tax=Nippostrongylus brasiliensis TaxID=27835 RepID=A0A0N4YYJ6_NIPBR|nr:unnamed protein product [Nippostrongylus brasiliensis]